MLQGYRTIILNLIALTFALFALKGIEIDEELKAQISTGILAIANIFWRFATKTPVGKKCSEGSFSSAKNDQSGNSFTSFLVVVAMTTLMLIFFIPGCALAQRDVWQPFSDCAEIKVPDNRTIGACFVVVKILAVNTDAAADAGIITSEQERVFLEDLSAVGTFLSQVRSFVSTDPESASERLQLAQNLLSILIKQIPQPERHL